SHAPDIFFPALHDRRASPVRARRDPPRPPVVPLRRRGPRVRDAGVSAGRLLVVMRGVVCLAALLVAGCATRAEDREGAGVVIVLPSCVLFCSATINLGR